MMALGAPDGVDVRYTASDAAEDAAHSGLGPVLGRTVGLGAITGLRVASGWAAASRAATQGLLGDPTGTRWSALASARLSPLFRLGVVGELVVDKLPFTPSRLLPGPLAGRVGSGALIGAIQFSAADLPPLRGLVIGGAAGALGSYGGYHLRRVVVQRTGLPDPVVAVLEDALALAGSRAVLRRPWTGLLLGFVLAVAAMAVPRSAAK